MVIRRRTDRVAPHPRRCRRKCKPKPKSEQRQYLRWMRNRDQVTQNQEQLSRPPNTDHLQSAASISQIVSSWDHSSQLDNKHGCRRPFPDEPGGPQRARRPTANQAPTANHDTSRIHLDTAHLALVAKEHKCGEPLRKTSVSPQTPLTACPANTLLRQR